MFFQSIDQHFYHRILYKTIGLHDIVLRSEYSHQEMIIKYPKVRFYLKRKLETETTIYISIFARRLVQNGRTISQTVSIVFFHFTPSFVFLYGRACFVRVSYIYFVCNYFWFFSKRLCMGALRHLKVTGTRRLVLRHQSSSSESLFFRNVHSLL